MGSKTPQEEYEGGNGHPSDADKPSNAGGQPRGTHMSRDGDGCLGDGDSDADDGDGDGGEVNGVTADGGKSTAAKKKRKKRSKKKKAGWKQTSPPRVPLTDVFPTGDYPKGELQSYASKDDTTVRTTAAEARANDRQVRWEDENWLKEYRRGAEIHRQVRQWAQENVIKPGKTTLEIAEGIEESVRALLGNSGLEEGSGRISGMGFPTGVCLNHQVAHYTPNPGQKEVVLKQSDVVTVDFGVHINGWIVDSAFTVAFDPVYDNLLAAVKDATNTGIKTAGIDVRISDVSAAIQEAMESYEVELEGKTFPVKAIRNLTGHNIVQGHIHGGKSIPFVKNKDQTKMEEGEVFAIETFGSTGRGYIVDDVGVYGYALNHDAPLKIPVSLSSAKKLHKTIRDNFSTIPFCRRYLERLGTEKYLAGMNCLVANGIVEEYGLLRDIKGSYSAQFEHTFIQRETCKEVLSRGDDY